MYESFCQGLELDIFPFDFCNCSDGQQKFDKIKSLILDLSTYMRMSNPNLGEADKKRVAGYSGRNPLETFEEIERLCTSDAEETSSLAGLISGDFYGFKRQSYPKGLFYDLVDMVFYGLKVPAPKNYDAVLKTEYGDYMKFPKIEDRGTWHTGGIIDACTSYTNYIKPHLSVRKTI